MFSGSGKTGVDNHWRNRVMTLITPGLNEDPDDTHHYLITGPLIGIVKGCYFKNYEIQLIMLLEYL